MLSLSSSNERDREHQGVERNGVGRQILGSHLGISTDGIENVVALDGTLVE